MLLSFAVVAGHLLPGLGNSEIENGIRNALHILAFAVFAAIVFESLAGLGTGAAIVAIFLVIATVGGLSELLQYSTGHRPDVIDVARDLLGAALAVCGRLLWRWSQSDPLSSLARGTLRAGSLLLSVLIAVPLLYWLSIIALNKSTFPTILSFDHWWETHLYHPLSADVVVSVTGQSVQAGVAAEIRFSKRGRSGLGVYPMVSNWTDYNYLTFIARIVHGPDTAVTVRINDGLRLHHFSDHFMAKITVTSESRLFRI